MTAKLSTKRRVIHVAERFYHQSVNGKTFTRITYYITACGRTTSSVKTTRVVSMVTCLICKKNIKRKPSLYSTNDWHGTVPRAELDEIHRQQPTMVIT